ncbi:MAG: flagellar hook-length control protein FliK [Lachnospiraceae bacterium]|nr:flagellar hook-length control protein FliK [Lachnospiraceae bacterium]
MDNITGASKIRNVFDVSSLSKEGVSSEKAGLEALRNMSSGETFTGKIVDINGNTATISLGADARVTAELDTNANLNVGQSVVFEIGTDSENSVSLRALFTNLASENIANNALTQAGIPVNNTSLALISTLMEQGMGIDKETVTQAYRAIVANPEVATEEIVRMKQIGLELTSDNIAKFDAVTNFESKISDSINSLINQIPLELSAKADTDLSASIKMASSFIDAALEGESEVSVSLGDIALSSEGEGLGLASENASENSSSLAEGMAGENEEANQNATLTKDTVKNIISDLTDSGIISDEEGEVINENSGARELSEQITLTNKDFDALNSLTTSGNTYANEIIDKLSSGQQIDLEELLKTFDSILKDPNVSDESKRELIKSELFKGAITDKFSEKWLLEPSEIKDSESLNTHYNKVLENTDKILDSMQNAFKGSETLTQSANAFKENVQFLQTLNDLTPYVQLPLLMNNRSNTGDLYVYANKKNLLENKDNISAVLRLDMKNLGMVQVYVKLNSSKNLSTDFTLPDEDTLKFIEDHIDILNEKLEKLGFNVTNSFNTKSEAPRPLLDDDDNTEKKDSIGFYRFDVRA